MITYTPINLKEKVEFEKEHQLPYGYNNAEVFYSFDEAVNWFYKTLGPTERREWVIEKHSGGYTDIVFKL